MTRSRNPTATPPPDFVEPCLATAASAPPSGDQWVHEIKYDGYRLQARLHAGDVRLLTRTGLDWTAKLGVLAKPLVSLAAANALIDGEVIVEDATGASDFMALVADLKSRQAARMVFVAFDLLFLDGLDLRGQSLFERKTLLGQLISPMEKGAALRYSEYLHGDAAAILSSACKLGLEGIVSKRIDKPYRSGRRPEWVKAKCLLSDEFIVVGYIGSSSMTDAIGALALGVYVDNKLVYVGRVGTGFSHKAAGALWRMLQPLRVTETPLARKPAPPQAKGVVWTRPQLVARIEYRAWTCDGIIRHAAFKAVRNGSAGNTP